MRWVLEMKTFLTHAEKSFRSPQASNGMPFRKVLPERPLGLSEPRSCSLSLISFSAGENRWPSLPVPFCSLQCSLSFSGSCPPAKLAFQLYLRPLRSCFPTPHRFHLPPNPSSPHCRQWRPLCLHLLRMPQCLLTPSSPPRLLQSLSTPPPNPAQKSWPFPRHLPSSRQSFPMPCRCRAGRCL